MDMALTAYLQFGSNVTRRYFKEYMVSDCHIVHKRKYNRFCPEGNADGMVCEGYVVGIEEQFSTTRMTTAGDTKHLSPADKQMEITIKLLLQNTTYIGRDNNFKSIFIH